MPDTPKGPEQDPKNAAPAAGAGTGTTPPSDDLRAQLERERQERQKREREIADLRSSYDRTIARKDFELQQARRAARPDADSGYDAGGGASRDPNDDALRNEIATLRAEQGYIRFKQDYPDSGPVWNDINALVNDPSQVPLVASYIPGSTTPDIYGTLRNAYREVQFRRLQAAEAAAAKEREKLEAAKESNKRRAVISGSAASGEEPPADIAKMTPKEMLEKGLLNDFIDPQDPPLALRGK